jgi:hypothetical protein
MLTIIVTGTSGLMIAVMVPRAASTRVRKRSSTLAKTPLTMLRRHPRPALTSPVRLTRPSTATAITATLPATPTGHPPLVVQALAHPCPRQRKRSIACRRLACRCRSANHSPLMRARWFKRFQFPC